jgi:hypothetical protein
MRVWYSLFAWGVLCTAWVLLMGGMP